MQETTGHRLAAARKAMDLSIQDVAERTRIRADFLAALENMDMRALPARAYVNGFVRAYANCVGLDPAAITAQFAQEIAPERPMTPGDTVSRMAPPMRAPLVLAGGVAAIAAGFVVWSGVGPSEPPVVDDIPPVPEALKVWMDTEPGTPASLAALEALADAERPQVILRAVAPTRVTVKTPQGQALFDGRLRTGQTVALPNRPGIEVSVADGGNVEVLSGDENLGRLGPAGAPVSAWAVDQAFMARLNSVEPSGG